MKWLITLVLGALMGAAAVLFFLSKVPNVAAPAALVVAPPAPSAQQAPAASAVALPEAALPIPLMPTMTAAPETSTVETMPHELETLMIPVQGVGAAQLSDTFNQTRGNGRRHEALDILAPRGTKVWAAGDGTVAKLFTSKPGGLTIYQFDPSKKYAYYYAHLDRYAPDIKEGQQVKRGELIAYVGSSGNADPATPHLHFAIFELGPEKQWWKGTPVNPYPVLRGQKLP